MTKETLEEIKTKTIPIFRKYGVKRAGVFGSFARGESKKESDIDFYVIYPAGVSLFDIGGLAYNLEEKLDKKVDLADGKMLKKKIKPYIMKDLKIFYEKR